MKKTLTSVVAVSIMSSVSFAQDAPKAPATKSTTPIKQTMVPIPVKQSNPSGQKASNTNPVLQKGVNAKPGANKATAAPKAATTDGPIKQAKTADSK